MPTQTQDTSLSRHTTILTRNTLIEDYLAHLGNLDRFSFDQFEKDDFFEDAEGDICNKYFYDGCPFLFVAWIGADVPVMVYNRSVVRGLSPEEVKKDWESIWDCMYYKRPADVKEPRGFITTIVDKMQVHMWPIQLGMY